MQFCFVFNALTQKKKKKKLAALTSFSNLFSFSGESMGHIGDFMSRGPNA